MKASVLVAAAMVITSVNAAGKGGLKGLFKKGGGMTRSESEANLLEKNNPEPEPPQKSLEDESTQVVTWGPLMHNSAPVEPQDLTPTEPASVVAPALQRHRPRQGPSQDSLARGSRPGPSQDPSKDEPRPGPSQKRPVYKFGASQVSKPRKKDPVCDLIVAELRISRDSTWDFDFAFSRLTPDFYKLMKRQSDDGFDNMARMRMTKLRKNNSVVGTSEDEEKEKKEEKEKEEEEERKASASRVEAIQKWIGSHPKSIPDLESIKAEYINLEKNHGEIWARLLSSNCPTEGLKHFSLEYMKKQGYFPKWNFEINLINLDDQ
ncbi:hypothetical protein BASA83_009958 [Batrachochytrium salamandrivorans]|nr:hypothetical protein BASA83_009958 [Batrachochytrium salamandrivorans]